MKFIRLKTDKKFYEFLIKNLPEKIFFKDTHSRYVLINKSFADDIGIEPEDIQGKIDFDIFPKKIAKKYRKDDRYVIKTGKQKKFIDQYYPKGKKKCIVECIKTPVKEEMLLVY